MALISKDKVKNAVNNDNRMSSYNIKDYLVVLYDSIDYKMSISQNCVDTIIWIPSGEKSPVMHYICRKSDIDNIHSRVYKGFERISKNQNINFTFLKPKSIVGKTFQDFINYMEKNYQYSWQINYACEKYDVIKDI